MSIRSYYRWALLLPLVLPLISFGVIQLWPRQGSAVAYMVYGSLWVGGVPYVLFALGLLAWSRGRTDDQMRRAILLAPPIFTAVLLVCLVVFQVVDGNLSRGTDFFATAAGCGLAFGYGYVALAELGRLLLRPHPAAPATTPAV